MAARLAEARALEALLLDSDLAEKADAGAVRKKKRAAFGRFAKLWNDAEEAGDAEVLELLRQMRPRMKLVHQRQNMLQVVGMYVRFALTVFVASWGSVCLLLVAPLRLTHPFLRRCGLPNGLLPVDLCLYLWSLAVLSAAGVRPRLRGAGTREVWGEASCGLIVYNHASNLDPFIVSLVCGQLAPKYVGKKVLFKIPFYGWLSLAAGMVPINRGDREKAVRTMNETVGGIMRRWGRSVAVSPEGTRTVDGHLVLPFKKGTFHLQSQTRAPLLPLVIHGAFDLWPPGQLFTAPGEVEVTVLPQQSFKPETTTREAARLALQRSMAGCLEEKVEVQSRPLSGRGAMECFACLLCTALVFHRSWRLYLACTAALGLSTAGVCGLLVCVTIVIAVVVDQLV